VAFAPFPAGVYSILAIERFGNRGLEQPLHAKVESTNIKAPERAGRAVLAFNYGVFGDNVPVFWVKHIRD